jgi:ABC-type protease/lipase transport system fused ATPase/permease subunit
MQEEIQCPNCKSYYTKSETQAFRLNILLLTGILFVLFIYTTFANSSGFSFLLALISLAIFGVYADRYFIQKANSGHCKSCNYKWRY